MGGTTPLLAWSSASRLGAGPCSTSFSSSSAVERMTSFARFTSSTPGSCTRIWSASLWRATTGSATVLAMGTLVAIVPGVVLGPFVGALVDRWNRRIVMMAAAKHLASVTLELGGKSPNIVLPDCPDLAKAARAAAGAIFYWLRPERWLASLEPAPWRELALGLEGGGPQPLEPAPIEGVRAEDLAALHALLLGAGVPIGRINAVRKRFSRWGAGRLAAALECARVIPILLAGLALALAAVRIPE